MSRGGCCGAQYWRDFKAFLHQKQPGNQDPWLSTSHEELTVPGPSRASDPWEFMT